MILDAWEKARRRPEQTLYLQVRLVLAQRQCRATIKVNNLKSQP